MKSNDPFEREPTVEEFYGLLSKYDVDYKIMQSREVNKRLHGRINFYTQKIHVDPRTNDEGITLAHEFIHLYYQDYMGIDDISESTVENLAQDFYSSNKKTIDKYCERRLNRLDDI